MLQVAAADVRTNTETLTADKTLVLADKPVQVLDPGGSARTITLPVERDASEGKVFTIVNAADAAEALTINDPDASAVGKLERYQRATFFCNGTNWFNASGPSAGFPVQSTAALTLAEADVLDGATAGTQVASKAVVADANVNTGVSKVTELHIGATGAETQVTSTAAELNQLDGNILNDMAVTAGVGISGTADNFASKVEKVGSLFKTTIVIDIDGLNSSATIGDIIGADGAGAAHLGQITAARNGTIFAGRLTCLETPATGDDDIDLYSASEATGVEDTAIGDLTETQLCNSGDLTNASIIPLTAFPAADEYLYLVGHTADGAGTYTAGILVIELWGK